MPPGWLGRLRNKNQCSRRHCHSRWLTDVTPDRCKVFYSSTPNDRIDKFDEADGCRPYHESTGACVPSLEMPRQWDKATCKTDASEDRKKWISRVAGLHDGFQEEQWKTKKYRAPFCNFRFDIVLPQRKYAWRVTHCDTSNSDHCPYLDSNCVHRSFTILSLYLRQHL